MADDLILSVTPAGTETILYVRLYTKDPVKYVGHASISVGALTAQSSVWFPPPFQEWHEFLYQLAPAAGATTITITNPANQRLEATVWLDGVMHDSTESTGQSRLDVSTTESHGVTYIGTTATTDTKLLADRAAEELKIKAAMGYDSAKWPHTDYDGNVI